MTPDLQQEVQDLQKRMAVELKPLVLESTLTIQKILEANGHTDRVQLLRYFIDAERKRLEAKKTLQGMFTGVPSAVTTEPIETKKDERKDEKVEGKMSEGNSGISSRSSLLTDEPDAFQ